MTPKRFWRRLHPSQPSRPARLLAYAVLILLLTLLPAMVDLTISADPKGGIIGAVFFSISTRERLAWDFSTQFPLNMLYAPLHTMPRQLLLWMTAAMLVLPLINYGLLLMFQQTLRRARLRAHHVWRCVIYSADVLIWPVPVLCGIILFHAIQHRSGRQSEELAWTLLISFPLIWLIMAWRLRCAYRYYLRFDHPGATIFAVQLIIFMLLLLIM